jgi:hypothetical protein
MCEVLYWIQSIPYMDKWKALWYNVITIEVPLNHQKFHDKVRTNSEFSHVKLSPHAGFAAMGKL